jgi:hypothetical protein
MSDADEITLDADKLHSNLQKWKNQDAKRASDAGETRQSIGQFVEDTGVNKKALSHIRQIDKMPEEKRADYLRSSDALMAEMRPHWDGQSTADMFDPEHDDAVEPPEEAEPEANDLAEDNVTAFDPEAETAEFEAEVDGHYGDDTPDEAA